MTVGVRIRKEMNERPRQRAFGLQQFESLAETNYSYRRTARLLGRFHDRAADHPDLFSEDLLNRITKLHASIKQVSEIEKAKKKSRKETEDVDM